MKKNPNSSMAFVFSFHNLNLLSVVLLLLASFAAVRADVQFRQPTQQTELETSGQVAVQIVQTSPVEGTQFLLRLRLCKAIFGGCFDDHLIVPVPMLDAAVQWTDKTQPLEASFPASEQWETSDKYLITIEAVDSDFRGQSSKFTITNTRGTITITKPAANAQLLFEQVNEIKFQTANIPGQDVGFFTQVVDSNDNVVYNGSPVSGQRDELVPTESFGPPGTYKLRVVLTSNNDIAGEKTIKLAHPSAYFTITEPTSATSWQTGGSGTVQWAAMNLPPDATVELFDGDQAVANLGQGSGGVQATVPAELRSGFGYRVRVSGLGPDQNVVESFSPSFQIIGSDAVQGSGLCRFNETNPRHAICATPDGSPIMQTGNQFAVLEMQFLWQTCVSLHGTTLDVFVKYRDESQAIKVDGQDNHNFLPDDGDKTITVLNGKSSPYFLDVIMEQVVKQPKQLEPFPGTWQFSTDLYISPFGREVENRAKMPLALGLVFNAPNPDCKDSPDADPNIPPGCTEDTANGCEPVKPQAQDLFEPGESLCTSHQIGALNNPCGDQITFTRTSSKEKLLAMTGKGEYCGGTFYVQVQSSINQGRTGWVPTSSVQQCPRPCNPPQCRKNGQCVICEDANQASIGNAVATSAALGAAATLLI